MMATDDERREVARRLRENAEAHPDMSLILNLAFADDSLKPDGAMEWKVTSHDAAMRLADLVEPSEPKVKCVAEVKVDGEQLEKLAHDAAVELTGIDREALLELAEELANVRRWSCYTDSDLLDIADRIREALGVVES